MSRLLSLRFRILIMLAGLVVITVAGGLTSIWHTHSMGGLFHEIAVRELPSLKAAQRLEGALVMQKGYVTYFFQDGDFQWLEELNRYHEEFESLVNMSRKWATSAEERATLNEIEAQYIRYARDRDEVILMYREGERQKGFRLHQKVRTRFFRIIELCRQFSRLHEQHIDEASSRSLKEAQAVYWIATVAMAMVLVLAVSLAYTLLRDILEPIRKLAAGPVAPGDTDQGADEVEALRNRFRDLMDDIDKTKTKLEWSREHLEQAEKWAMVGKLAAGVAHSVRNPLTSVKIRLFSLERTLDLAPNQQEDLDVISEEIRHIDSIVNNFLEFARPPKLKVRSSSPSDVVDTAVQLLRHRLDSCNVVVEVQRKDRLPQISVDPDQLKEVLVNLLVNSCEAMISGGRIVILEELGEDEALGPVVTVTVSDNGPGIPKSLSEDIFQPFMSSKEEGTGLGLSIAKRIVEEHGGNMETRSSGDTDGATIVITIPARGDEEIERLV